MSVVATIGGVPLTAAQRFSWTLTAGVRPFMRAFETSLSCAAQLMELRGSPLELVIDSPGHPRASFAGLYVIESTTGTTPWTRNVVIADRRYFWQRASIARDFNMRRRVGENRLIGEERIENRQLVPTIAYAPWSLDNGVPWTPGRALESVLRELSTASGGGMEFSIGPLSRQIVIENLSFESPGDEALRRVLDKVVGFDVTVDSDGRIRVFDTRDQSEAAVVAQAAPALAGSGYSGFADRSFARPAKVNILFEREVELRFNHTEGETIGTYNRDQPPRKIVNVIPSPDAAPLVVNGVEVAQDTILAFDDWLAALPASPRGNRLTQAGMRLFFMANRSYIEEWYIQTADFVIDPVWAKRWRAAFSHWRQTYQILPEWRDKIKSFSAVRALLIDPTTGRRAPARAYMDYLAVPSQRGLGKTRNENTDIGHQVAGYPASGLLKDGITAPVDITIKDQESFVFRVHLAPDPWREAETLVPGNVDTFPNYRPSKVLPGGKLAILAYYYFSPLKANFKAAVVLSCIQGAPNNNGRYHRETVTPSEAERVLGQKIGDCTGPAYTILVGGGITTARMAWKDEFADQIEAAFFRGDDYPPGLLSNVEEIRNIALAEAAAVYSPMLDRVEGAYSIAIRPDLQITGALSFIEHSVELSGAALTTLTLLPALPRLDYSGLMDPAIQRITRRLVGSGGI